MTCLITDDLFHKARGGEPEGLFRVDGFPLLDILNTNVMTVSARVEKCMEMALMPGQVGLLKPVIQSRPESSRPYDFMFVKSEHNVIKISFSDIYYIEGYKDYVKIYTGGPRPVMTILTFRSLEEILPRNQFVRIHKSFIISIEKIKSFRRGKVLVMDRHIPIGASYSDAFNQQVVAGRLIDY